MSELFESVFADLEFTEGDEVKIEDGVLLFVFHELSQKLRNLRKIIRPSCPLQHFIVETLDTETESHSWEILIFFVDSIYEMQDFVHRIWIEFYTQFCNIFKIELSFEVIYDIDDPVDADSARSSSSDIKCFDFFIGKFFCIIIYFFF